jgi:hypothetical protein
VQIFDFEVDKPWRALPRATRFPQATSMGTQLCCVPSLGVSSIIRNGMAPGDASGCKWHQTMTVECVMALTGVVQCDAREPGRVAPDAPLRSA